MAHSLRITRRAYEQIEESADYIALDSPEAARRWRDKILVAIESLQIYPLRHSLAPEAEAVGTEVHQMMHGRYRILYTLAANVVTVHGVRHGARRPLRPDELPRPD
jgi:plasmid stabilization system protein ParE